MPVALGAKQYRIELALIFGNTADGGIRLFANGDTTLTNYQQQQVKGLSTTPSAGTVNEPRIAYSSVAATDDAGHAVLDVSIVGDGLMVSGIFTRVEGATNVASIFQYGIHNFATTFSAIDTLQFAGEQANSFGVGTRIRILKS